MRASLLFAFSLLAVVAIAFAAAGESIVQLDEMTLSSQESARLSAELAKLRGILDDPTLGSQHKLGQDGWDSESFAVFSGGSLAERGYSVSLAENGSHVWVLVAISLGDRIAWIPIEPTPSAGTPQHTLGMIPFALPGTTSLRLKDEYLVPSSTFSLPSNRAPTAALRTSETSISIGATVRLIASLSTDPDGRIVTYRWCVGEGSCVATTSWTYVVNLDELGENRITLFVVDNAGRSASADVVVSVHGEGIEPSQSPLKRSGDCGCGG